MSDDDTRYDEIHSYLLGEMDPHAAAAFESRLDADPELAAALQQERELALLLRQQRRIELKQMLRDIPIDRDEEGDEDQARTDSAQDHSAPKSGGGIRPPYFKYVLYASGLAACVIAAVIIFNPGGGKIDYMEIFEAQMERPYRISNTRGDKDTLQGYAAFKTGQFGAALAQLDTTLQDSEALLIHGISAMQVAQWPQARRDLGRVEALRDDNFALRATWYLALLDLREQQLSECRRRLRIVQAQGDINHLEAGDLLKSLELGE